MSHYEKLIEDAIQQGLGDLERKASSQGCDGVCGVKFSHPLVVDGGVEIVIYGNGYRLKPSQIQ